MTAEQLKALERIASDSKLLAGLIERTMIPDADLIPDRDILAEIRQVQCSLVTIHSRVEKLMRALPAQGLELRVKEGVVHHG